MSDYKTIRGYKIKQIASDASPVYAGQAWFETAEAVLKVRTYTAGAWSSGGNMNAGRYTLFSGGSQTSAFAAGGETTDGSTSGLSEEYNGASWAEGSNINKSRHAGGGFGSANTAGAIAGGVPNYVALTEEYNGASWAESGDLTNGRITGGGGGV